MAFFRRREDQVRRPGQQEPARLPPLQPRRDGRRQVDEGPPALRRRATGTRSAARAATRSAPAAPSARGRTAPTPSRWPSSASASPSSSWRSSASRSTASTTATSPPRARTSRETNANLDTVVEGAQGGAAAHRHQAALGHRQPVQQPALRPRGQHQLQRRRLRLRRRPGEEGPGGDQGTRRRELRLLGRPRGLHQPLQHRPEARARPPRQVLPPGRRLQEEDRLHRPVPDRAEAEGADHATSTTSTAPTASPSSAATAWTRTSSSTSRPTTPRWPGTR